MLRPIHDHIAAGELVGPELFFTGPMREGNPLTYAGMNENLPGFTVAIDSPEDVEHILPDLSRQGTCMVKPSIRGPSDFFVGSFEGRTGL